MKKSKINRRYGWVRGKHNPKDKSALVVAKLVPKVTLPPSADLRKTGLLPCVYDQGALSSCVGNSVAAAVAYDMAKQQRDYIFSAPPSRLFLYYQARRYRGWQNQDRGCFIRDAFKALDQYGVCSEKDWDYVEERVNWPPTPPCYRDALGEQSVSYGSIQNDQRDTMRLLLSNGWPIVAGIMVYESFESEDVRRTGLVPMPKPGEGLLGGHSVLIVGYEDGDSHYTVQNSWGDHWGDHGFLYMPYEYLESARLAGDFWVVTQVE